MVQFSDMKIIDALWKTFLKTHVRSQNGNCHEKEDGILQNNVDILYLVLQSQMLYIDVHNYSSTKTATY